MCPRPSACSTLKEARNISIDRPRILPLSERETGSELSLSLKTGCRPLRAKSSSLPENREANASFGQCFGPMGVGSPASERWRLLRNDVEIARYY